MSRKLTCPECSLPLYPEVVDDYGGCIRCGEKKENLYLPTGGTPTESTESTERGNIVSVVSAVSVGVRGIRE